MGALWVLGKRYQDMEDGWEVVEAWDPLLEADPTALETWNDDQREEEAIAAAEAREAALKAEAKEAKEAALREASLTEQNEAATEVTKDAESDKVVEDTGGEAAAPQPDVKDAEAKEPKDSEEDDFLKLCAEAEAGESAKDEQDGDAMLGDFFADDDAAEENAPADENKKGIKAD